MKLVYSFTFAFLLLLSCDAQVQESDTARLQRESKAGFQEPGIVGTYAEDTVVVQTNPNEKDPDRAAILSAVVPGLGQVYNNKPWKLPIIYGTGITLAYFLKFNNDIYIESRNALLAIKDEDDRTQNPIDFLDESDHVRRAEFFRKNRDLLIVTSVAFYFLQIVEAYVDAHLDQFIIEENLTFRILPGIQQTPGMQNAYGLRLTLNFNK
ncbi:MAG TPA: hypothetical protein DDY13_02340 [Cytophagales bacterium]|jgi:hypothetical protein|nr:hypothetical protein [Cytophagales bacterium]